MSPQPSTTMARLVPNIFFSFSESSLLGLIRAFREEIMRSLWLMHIDSNALAERKQSYNLGAAHAFDFVLMTRLLIFACKHDSVCVWLIIHITNIQKVNDMLTATATHDNITAPDKM